jgi:hypothetical protein
MARAEIVCQGAAWGRHLPSGGCRILAEAGHPCEANAGRQPRSLSSSEGSAFAAIVLLWGPSNCGAGAHCCLPRLPWRTCHQVGVTRATASDALSCGPRFSPPSKLRVPTASTPSCRSAAGGWRGGSPPPSPGRYIPRPSPNKRLRNAVQGNRHPGSCRFAIALVWRGRTALPRRAVWHQNASPFVVSRPQQGLHSLLQARCQKRTHATGPLVSEVAAQVDVTSNQDIGRSKFVPFKPFRIKVEG